MNTPINEFQDILDAMERNPALRDALRRQILGDELLQMPVRLRKVEADIANLTDITTNLTDITTGMRDDISVLKETTSTMQTDISVLKETTERTQLQLAITGGHVSNLIGSDYESHIARNSRRILLREMGVLTTMFSTQRQSEHLTNLVLDAELQGQLLPHETDSLANADLVLTEDETGNYILAEISLTVQQGDIDRAIERAALLAKATGRNATPIAVGTALNRDLDPNTLPCRVLLLPHYRDA